MRKLKRAVIRHMAEVSDGKTIKVFRNIWKKSRDQKGHITTPGNKKVKKQSLLKRSIRKRLGGKEK